MTERYLSLKAVILDWAGTTIDYGSCAPASVFQEIFFRRGVPISAAQARAPMGMAKREHIAAIAKEPVVATAWLAVHGAECSELEIDRMYADFLPLQKETLRQHCDLIPGVSEAVSTLRKMGLRIGSTTGYTQELMEMVTAAARDQGYHPECVVCAEDAVRGRPAPYLIYEAAQRLDVYPLKCLVVVDDTTVGVQAGRHAGCWTIGVTKSGNEVGLSAAELDRLPALEVTDRIRRAEEELLRAGAHLVIESVADLIPAVLGLNQRYSGGEHPDG